MLEVKMTSIADVFPKLKTPKNKLYQGLISPVSETLPKATW